MMHSANDVAIRKFTRRSKRSSHIYGMFRLLIVAAMALAAPALAESRMGFAVTLFNAEKRVVPTMRGWDYLGPDVVTDTGVFLYRLGFHREGRAVLIYVDTKTGAIVGRTAPMTMKAYCRFRIPEPSLVPFPTRQR